MGVWVEEEGCLNFEQRSKFIRSAYADRAALKTRHWRVFFTLRATGAFESLLLRRICL